MVLCRSRQGPGLPTQWGCHCGASCHTAVWGGLSPVGTATDTNTSPGCDSVGDSPGWGSRGKSLLMPYFDFKFFVLTILENANTYINIVNYITKTLVRSFVLVVGSPTTITTSTTTIAGRVPVPTLRHDLLKEGQLETAHPPRSLFPSHSKEDRGGRRVGRHRGELNVVVICCAIFPLPHKCRFLSCLYHNFRANGGASRLVRMLTSVQMVALPVSCVL